MKLRISLLVIAVFLVSFSHASAQCSAPANTQFQPFSGGENNPSGHFEWYSAAAPNPQTGGGHPSHVFERHVKNLGSTTLKYDWPVGRMHNDALSPGTSDPFCYEYGWPNQADGPLHYGRGNDETKTTVWEGKDEPKTGAIWAIFAFNIGSGDGAQKFSMRVMTSVRKTPSGSFSYDYLFESLSGKVTVQWDVEKYKTLMENLKKRDMSATFAVEGKREFLIDTVEAPTVQFRALNVIVANRAVAGVEVPMFIPTKSLISEKRM